MGGFFQNAPGYWDSSAEKELFEILPELYDVVRELVPVLNLLPERAASKGRSFAENLGDVFDAFGRKKKKKEGAPRGLSFTRKAWEAATGRTNKTKGAVNNPPPRRDDYVHYETEEVEGRAPARTSRPPPRGAFVSNYR